MRLIPALALLAACGAPETPPKDDGPAPAAGANTAPSDAAAVADALTGLWEGGQAATPDQLCMVETGPGTARFGLVVWGGNLHSCSGAGEALREGDRLTLAMAGDSKCEIGATMTRATVSLPASVPAGCAYYCGARASLGGARFLAKGSGPEAARKATDLAGDQLCEAG